VQEEIARLFSRPYFPSHLDQSFLPFARLPQILAQLLTILIVNTKIIVMITSIEIAQLLQRQQKQVPAKKTGFDNALVDLGVALSGKKIKQKNKK
jgi:hypothetical protein